MKLVECMLSRYLGIYTVYKLISMCPLENSFSSSSCPCKRGTLKNESFFGLSLIVKTKVGVNYLLRRDPIHSSIKRSKNVSPAAVVTKDRESEREREKHREKEKRWRVRRWQTMTGADKGREGNRQGNKTLKETIGLISYS